MASQTQAQPGDAAEPPILTIADFIGDPVEAAVFPEHRLRWRNDRAAATVGLHGLSDADWTGHFGRFHPLTGNLSAPLALRYHGHQFGTYNPDLGDGRGFLYAQLRDDKGRWLDLGTKGSGQTPYSRFGDGRLTLKGAVRELLATEMLEALGVPTSRTFSIIETGEQLHRDDEPSPTRSAVLVRLSHGHIRIGSFQRLATLGEAEEMERLLRYVLVFLHGRAPEDVAAMPVADAAGAMLGETVRRCAATVAAQMVAGFVHGVLNTDNINVTGESFDYGPWRFLTNWDPAFTAAYFDHSSLYAFGRQPQVVHWNLGQLALALRMIAPAEPLTDALERFAPAYQAAIARQFCWRLGVEEAGAAADGALALAAERAMRASAMTVDQFFAEWAPPGHPASDSETGELAAALAGRQARRAAWSGAVPSLPIATVEQLWAPIAEADDWQPLYSMIEQIRAFGRFMATGSETG